MKTPDWMDVEMDKADVMIIDIGYVTEQSSRDRADKIFALGIGKKNLVWGPSTGGPRIHIHIPKSKRKKVLVTLPISDKVTWFGATHSYHEN
ncbi:MAG TPA: hypothetical protein ENH94_08510 [Phycisphaerales bacterium]|nr:hypothetical protein [Phycisphaerales bacterium]